MERLSALLTNAECNLVDAMGNGLSQLHMVDRDGFAGLADRIGEILNSARMENVMPRHLGR